MKHVFFLYLFLLIGHSGMTADFSSNAPRAMTSTVTVRSDSLIQQKNDFKNKAAAVSIATGLLAAFSGIFGISTIATLEFGFLWVLLGGLLGAVALITGIVGLNRRKRLLKTIYRMQSDKSAPDLGRRKAGIGIGLGLIGIGVIVLLFIVAFL